MAFVDVISAQKNLIKFNVITTCWRGYHLKVVGLVVVVVA